MLLEDCYWIKLLINQLVIADMMNAEGIVLHVGKHVGLSKEKGFTLNQKTAPSEDRSKFMKYMIQSHNYLMKKTLPNVINNKEDFFKNKYFANISYLYFPIVL